MNYKSINKVHVLLALTCLGFVIFGYLRLNDTSLYTDSTRYVIWGTSFGHAKGFVDNTQPDPERYVVNAPLYSVVLAPVLLMFPYSLIAAKIWTLLLGVCVLALFFVWLRRRVGDVPALLGTMVLAFNPLMLVMATEAMSEMCFLALIILVLILLESYNGETSDRSHTFIWLLVILSFLPVLREVSVALLGAITVVFFLRRYYSAVVWIVVGAAVVAGLWMLRNLVIVGVPATSQSSNVSFIFGHFVTSANAPLIAELFQRLSVNIQGFYVFASSLLLYPFPQPLIVDPSSFFRAIFRLLGPGKYVLPFVVVPIAILGVREDLKQNYRALIRLLFCILYAFIIALYPVQDIRFLLPLLPFLIFYLILGTQVVLRVRILQNKILRMSLVSMACVIVVLPNIDCDFEIARTNWNYEHHPSELYKKIKETHVEKDIFERPWRLLGSWIDQNLPDSTVIASTYKELSIFIGDRKLLEINYGVPLPMFERMLRDYGVDYVLSAGPNETNRPYQFLMSESRRYWFEPIHSLSGLLLYKVHSALMEPPPASLPETAVPDTSTAAGLLQWGRTLILQGKYSQAIWDLAKAFSLGSSPALTMYQMTVAFAMAGQQFEATRTLQKLYRMPQSTSYIPAARMHLRAMEAYAHGMEQTGVYQRSQELFNVAAFYWNFGYRQQAFSLLRDILKQDTSFFVALLWGWDYATNLGDAQQANRYFKILESIDSRNPVVVGFRKLNALDDTLRRTKDPMGQSRIQLEKGKVYWSIGLFDEAFDCVERSIGLDRHNESASKYLAELFENTKKPWALRKVREMMTSGR